jgi:hypothetical protein
VRSTLGLRGALKPKTIMGIGNCSLGNVHTEDVYVIFRSLDGGAEARLVVTCLDDPVGLLPVFDWSAQKRHWPHLKDIPFPSCTGTVDIVFGADIPSFSLSLEEVSDPGDPEAPIARRTALGWSALGPLSQNKAGVLAGGETRTYVVSTEQRREMMTRKLLDKNGKLKQQPSMNNDRESNASGRHSSVADSVLADARRLLTPNKVATDSDADDGGSNNDAGNNGAVALVSGYVDNGHEESMVEQDNQIVTNKDNLSGGDTDRRSVRGTSLSGFSQVLREGNLQGKGQAHFDGKNPVQPASTKVIVNDCKRDNAVSAASSATTGIGRKVRQ